MQQCYDWMGKIQAKNRDLLNLILKERTEIKLR